MSVEEAIDPGDVPIGPTREAPAARKRACSRKGSSSKRRRINGSSSSSSSFMEISTDYYPEGKMLKLVDSTRFKEDIKRWAKAVVSYAHHQCSTSSREHKGGGYREISE